MSSKLLNESERHKHRGDSVTKSKVLNIVIIKQKQICMQIHRTGFVVHSITHTNVFLFPLVCVKVMKKDDSLWLQASSQLGIVES